MNILNSEIFVFSKKNDNNHNMHIAFTKSTINVS